MLLFSDSIVRLGGWPELAHAGRHKHHDAGIILFATLEPQNKKLVRLLQQTKQWDAGCPFLNANYEVNRISN